MISFGPRLSAVGYRLSAVGCGRERSAFCFLLSAFCFLPSAFCLLLTALRGSVVIPEIRRCFQSTLISARCSVILLGTSGVWL